MKKNNDNRIDTHGEEYLGMDAFGRGGNNLFSGRKKLNETQTLKLQIADLNLQLEELRDENSQLQNNLKVNKDLITNLINKQNGQQG